MINVGPTPSSAPSLALRIAVQPQSPFSYLPTEAWLTIFDFLPPSGLATVMRTKRLWHRIAEPLLYAKVHLSEDLTATSVVHLRTARCCQTIVEHGHLAAAMRTLRVRWTGVVDENGHPYIVQCLGLLYNVLQHTIHLETLELSLGGYAGPLQEVFESCTFPALRRLSLSGIGPDSLSPFLRRHRTITHLALPDLPGPPGPQAVQPTLDASHPPHGLSDLNPADLPRLTLFRGHASIASSLVPGRPVTILSIVAHEPLERHLHAFARTSTRLCVLDLGAVYTRPSQLALVAKYLPELAVLRLKLALKHTLHYALSGIMMLAALTEVLRRFDHLTTLDLSPTTIIPDLDKTTTAEGLLCEQWSRVCRQLRRVIFPSGNAFLRLDNGVWLRAPPPRILAIP